MDDFQFETCVGDNYYIFDHFSCLKLETDMCKIEYFKIHFNFS